MSGLKTLDKCAEPPEKHQVISASRLSYQRKSAGNLSFIWRADIRRKDSLIFAEPGSLKNDRAICIKLREKQCLRICGFL